MSAMVAKQRAVDRGDMRGRSMVGSVGAEIRLARTSLGLSLQLVASASGISASELSRIERARADWVSVVALSRLCAVVGLDLAVRAYPGGRPLRDTRHVRKLEQLHACLHPTLGWALEVPLPNPGDQRAWDAMVRGSDWRYGVECEMNPVDGQALLRRLKQKQRDGMVDGVILLLPETRQARQFRREYADALRSEFPVRASTALRQLATGSAPGGSAVVVM